MNTNNNYFRLTAYHADENLSVIMDCNGYYEKLWQFSSLFVQKGFTVLEVSNAEKFLDGNIQKTEPIKDNIILRASHTGKPEYTTYEFNGVNYRAVKVADKVYIPDRDRRNNNE